MLKVKLDVTQAEQVKVKPAGCGERRWHGKTAENTTSLLQDAERASSPATTSMRRMRQSSTEPSRYEVLGESVSPGRG